MEEDNQNVDCQQMAPTLSLPVRAILVQFFGCGDSLDTFWSLSSSLLPEHCVLTRENMTGGGPQG